MELEFGGISYPVGRVGLRIGLLPGPRLDLWFPSGQNPPPSAAVTAAALEGERVALVGQGAKLEFTLLGAAPPEEGLASGISGVALFADLLQWFAQPLTAEGSLLIYQRSLEPENNGEGDPTGWAFLRRLAGGRLAPGAPGLQQLIEKALPPASCVWRAVGLDHCSFLDQVASALAPRVPGLAGWCGVNVADQPLRFLSAIEPVMKLDAAWTPAPGCRAGRAPGVAGLGPDCLLRRELTLPGGPVQLLAAAASLGRPARAGDVGATGLDAADVTQLPTLPTAVEWTGRRFFAREVGLVVTRKEGDAYHAVAELRLGRPDPNERSHGGLPPQVLPALFKGWQQRAGHPTLFAEVTAELATWVAVGLDGRPDPEASLLAELLLPAASRADHAVFYVRRRVEDRLRLLIATSTAAMCLGGPQQYLTEMESHDVTINAPRIGLSASKVDVPRADADGVFLDGLAHTVAVRIGQDRCTVAAEKVQFTRDVQVDGKLEIQPG